MIRPCAEGPSRSLPRARLHLIDIAEGMLDQARARFAGDDAVSFTAGDLETCALPPADAYVSALAIHHLDDGAKQALFRRVFAALEPGATDGIVLDDAGNPVEYHVLKRHPGETTYGNYLDYDRIAVESMLHWFRADRAGQLPVHGEGEGSRGVAQPVLDRLSLMAPEEDGHHGGEDQHRDQHDEDERHEVRPEPHARPS